MFKTKIEENIYKFLFIVFAVILVVLMILNKNIIDVVYLGVIIILVLLFFTCKK